MLEVLQSQEQFDQARRALRVAGRSALEPAALKLLRRWHLVRGLPVGDFSKSWDVARTLQLIADRMPKDAAILDLGAYCSEVPVSLARMGFTDVHGLDLNPLVRRMPLAHRVHYAVGDFNNTEYAAASFDVVTAISVIEHGYEPRRLFAEIGRLLRSQGLFIASFDYWPQKIDTSNLKFFDLSWLIFSREDVERMLDEAARHDLRPLGELHFGAHERAIRCAGFEYTFAWVVLQKR